MIRIIVKHLTWNVDYFSLVKTFVPLDVDV